MNRHTQRIRIIQMLYTAEIDFDAYTNNSYPDIEVDDYCKMIVAGILQEKDELDKLIYEYSEHKTFLQEKDELDKLIYEFFREKALFDQTSNVDKLLLDYFVGNINHKTEKAVKKIIYQYFESKSTTQTREEIDKLISDYSENKSKAIDCITMQILRLAIYEIIYKEIEPKICISEAVNLSMEFYGNKSYSYINALLDTLVKDRIK